MKLIVVENQIYSFTALLEVSKMAKMHFIDGPAHGETIYLEGEPLEKYYMAGIRCSAVKYQDVLEMGQIGNMFAPRHIYKLQGRTPAQKTFVYYYIGEE